MTQITDKQIQQLDAFEDAWGTRLMEHLSAKDEIEASRAVSVYMSRKEKIGAFITGPLAARFLKNASPERKARNRMANSEYTIPALTKTFGERTLVDAMPHIAKTQEFADTVRHFGGNKLAALIEHSLR